MPKEYGEMIYAMLSELNGVVLAQMRIVNNNIANVQKIMLELNEAIKILSVGLKETREKRYQEEIDILESQMRSLQSQLNEKKAAKSTAAGTTSEKIRAVTADYLEDREREELKRLKIDWIDIRNKVLLVIITAVVLYLLQNVFQP